MTSESMNEWENGATLQRKVSGLSQLFLSSEMASFQVSWQSWPGPVGSAMGPQG